MSEKKPEWEQANEADDELLSADDLVTEVIPINGKPTISHIGLAKIANIRGISVTELNYKEVDTETDKGIFVWGSGVNKEGEIRHAAHFEPRSKPGGRELPQFDWAKAWSKFQRNLFKMFLYGDELVKETLEKWEQSKGKPPAQQQKSEPAIPPIEQVKNACRTASVSFLDDPNTKEFREKHDINAETLHAAAEELFGASDKWDINGWERYKKNLHLLRNQKGYLYEKITKPADEETETETEPEPEKDTTTETKTEDLKF